MEIYFETKSAGLYEYWYEHRIPCTLEEAERCAQRWEVLKRRHKDFDKYFRNFKINKEA